MFRDITDHVRGEQALREREQRLRLALDAAEMGPSVWYPEEDRTEAAAKLLQLFGLPPNASITHAGALAELVHPDDRARNEAAIRRPCDPNGTGHFHDELRLRRPDGTERCGRPRDVLRNHS